MDYDYEAWVDRARELVEELLGAAEVDEATGELILAGPWSRSAFGPKGSRMIVEERFQTIEDVTEFVGALGYSRDDRNHDAFVPYGEIQPLLQRDVAEIVEDLRIEDLISLAAQLASQERLFTFRDATKDPVIEGVGLDLAKVNRELLSYLSRHPEALYRINPRRFEEVVATIFQDFGYDVFLTPKARDGGYDIRAVHKDEIGTVLYLIECKRWAADRPVGVEVVRSLFGTAVSEQATFSVLATTSYFSPDAKQFASKHKYHLSLRDFKDLKCWLRKYGQMS